MKQYLDTPYFVSESGGIFRDGKELKFYILKKKSKPTYKTVKINKTTMYVHRIVAMTYLLNPNNLPQVNHIDGDKLNNHYTNLEWVTNKENRTHAIENGLMKVGTDYEHTKLSEDDVKYIRENYIPKHTEFGGRALSKKFGIGEAQISRIIHHTRWTHI